MSKMATPSAQIVQAIAFEILSNEIRLHPTKAMRDGDDATSTADLAHCLIVYSDEVQLIIAGESDFDRDDRSDEFLAKVNRIDGSLEFHLGFDLALQLVAKIMAEPLSEHDIVPLISKSRKKYAKAFDQHRRGVLASRVAKRQAAGKQAATRDMGAV